MKNAHAIVGNSSSGLIEAFVRHTYPQHRRPSKGRARGASVIDVAADHASIVKGLEKALDPDFRKTISEVSGLNPYEKAGTLDAIFNRLVAAPITGTKTFIDLD